MKCSTPGRYIKAFGRAVHCLAKIGEDIYFEGESNGLAVRTVSQSRSAYGSFLFHTSFFSKFSLQTQNSGELRCKVSSRSCLTIFKNLASLEKTVENFSLELKYPEGEFIFTLLHKTGVRKQFVLTFQECEGLNAIFDKSKNSVQLVANSKFLSECVVHFPPSVGEVVLSVAGDHAVMKNYVEETEQYAKVLQTEIKMLSSEFGSFQVPGTGEVGVTFCLKELRAIIACQDSLSVPLQLHFDSPGRPVILSMDGDRLWECDFVLATIGDSELSTQNTQNSSAVPAPVANPTPITISPPASPEEIPIPMACDFSPDQPLPPSPDQPLPPSPDQPIAPSPDEPVAPSPPPPASKRFKRLSSDEDSDGDAHISATANIMYCDESD